MNNGKELTITSHLSEVGCSNRVKNTIEFYSDKSIDTSRIKVIYEEETYSVGDKFKCDQGGVYMLCKIVAFTGQQALTLICLDDGLYWFKAFVSDKLYDITRDEFDHITGQESNSFTKIK